MDITPDIRALLPVWGTVQAAVAGRVSTHDLWSSIYNAQLEAGMAQPSASFAAVNQLRSLAAYNRNAMEQLQLDAGNIALGPQHIGQEVIAGQGNVDVYLARVHFTTAIEGVPFDDWVTLRYTGSLPATVGGLSNDIRTQLELNPDYDMGAEVSLDELWLTRKHGHLAR